MFSIQKVLKDAYEFYMARFTTVLGVTALVVFLASLFEYVISDIFYYSMIVGIVMAVFFGVVGVIIEIGYVKYLLKLVSGGFPTLEDLLKYSYLFWRYVFGGLLYILMVTIGMVLFIVPGVYLALRFMFVPMIIIDREIRIKEAFAKSTQLTHGSKWKLLGLVLILSLGQAVISALVFSSAGPVVQVAGTILISPYLVIAYIKAYRTLQGLN